MTDQHKRMDAMIERIERHQKALKLSDSQFVARYQRHLGSTKTWRERLVPRAWDEFGSRLDKWEKKLTHFVSELDGGSPIEDFYKDLPIAKYGSLVYEILQGTRTDRRCAILLGNFGVGKTVTLRRLVSDHPTTCTYVQADETWKDNRMRIACGLAGALGVAEERSASATFRGVIEHLKGRPITLMIDEVHEAGILIFKLVKTLIDQSMAKFVLASYPTAWAKLTTGSTDATAEAQQLLGRTLKPINTSWCRGLTLPDLIVYLEASAGLNGQTRLLAERILPDIKRIGNFRALADAIALARDNADDSNGDIDADLIEAAVHELAPLNTKPTVASAL